MRIRKTLLQSLQYRKYSFPKFNPTHCRTSNIGISPSTLEPSTRLRSGTPTFVRHDREAALSTHPFTNQISRLSSSARRHPCLYPYETVCYSASHTNSVKTPWPMTAHPHLSPKATGSGRSWRITNVTVPYTTPSYSSPLSLDASYSVTAKG